jgi:hypothetical protein
MGRHRTARRRHRLLSWSKNRRAIALHLQAIALKFKQL